MRNIILVLGTLFICVANAAMVSNDKIGNDPANEKLCATRAKGKAVPFEIDSRYVESARSIHPEAIFIAVDGLSPQLIECYQREGTGKFEPASMSPEQSFWHLPRPKQFEPGINTQTGQDIAAQRCIDNAVAKIKRTDFDHTVRLSIAEINRGSPFNKPGTSIAGARADRYDVAVKGKAFYKSSGPDLDAVNFTCLLSPMFEVKAIQLK